MHEQLLDPVILDRDRPLLFSQALSLRLSRLICLLDDAGDYIGLQGVEHLVEEVSVWHPRLILAHRVGQVLQQLWKSFNSLGINVLDS